MFFINDGSLYIQAPSVSDAWIKALQLVFFEGVNIKTQYDAPKDFPSRDVSSSICVTDPFSEPFNVRGKPRKVAGFDVYCHTSDVYCVEAIKGGYLDEVMTGDRDRLIWERGEDDKSYPYTYHDRLYNYKPFNMEDGVEFKKKLEEGKFEDEKEWMEMMLEHEKELIASFPSIDQIDQIIKKLKGFGYTRRAQAVTWRPAGDNIRNDSPCLRTIWCRVFEDGNGVQRLRFNTHWRSRDLFGAWEANVNGMLQIAKSMCDELGVEMGHYNDHCDSLHAYGRVKLVYKEIIPLLERVANVEGLLKPEYKIMLDKLVKDAESWDEVKPPSL